jgi:hypothetical protein
MALCNVIPKIQLNLMKKIISSILLAVVFCFANAQVPQTFNYQAVARNSAGNVLPNTLVSLRFAIHDSTCNGTLLYVETDSATTNQFGLFTIEIGNGSVVWGAFQNINWAVGAKYLSVELDAAGGTNYTFMGCSQMQSVPYALVAAKTLPQDGAFRLSYVNNGSLDWYYNDIGTNIIYNTKDFDFGNNANASVFTAPTNGVYHFDVILGFTVSSGDINNYAWFNLYLNKNWNTHLEEAYLPSSKNGITNMLTMSISTNVYLTVGEFVYVSYDAYASPNTNPVQGSFGSFSGYKVR